MRSLLLALISIFFVANVLCPIDMVPVYSEQARDTLSELILSLGVDM